MDKKLTIELRTAEAFVLHDFLGRFNEVEDDSRFEDQAEQRVLWDLECLLEKVLVAPFREDYGKLLDEARELVRDEDS